MISVTAVTRPANVVARLVVDDMPGMGVDWITKADVLEDGWKWTNVDQAIAAARSLSDGDSALPVGVFHAKGGYELYHLATSRPSMTTPRPLEVANYNCYVARTAAGRGLVTIVDGQDTADLMSAKSFEHYANYAGGEW